MGGLSSFEPHDRDRVAKERFADECPGVQTVTTRFGWIRTYLPIGLHVGKHHRHILHIRARL